MLSSVTARLSYQSIFIGVKIFFQPKYVIYCSQVTEVGRQDDRSISYSQLKQATSRNPRREEGLGGYSSGVLSAKIPRSAEITTSCIADWR